MVDRAQTTRAKQNKSSTAKSTTTRSAKSRTSQGENTITGSANKEETKSQEVERSSRRSSRRTSAGASITDPVSSENRQSSRLIATPSRQSLASDSSSNPSHRGNSPLSAPATPATSYSTFTNVSTSSSAPSSKGKRLARVTAPASSSTRSLIDSASSSSNQINKGKGKETPVTSTKRGRKRVRSPSPIEEAVEKTEPEQHRRSKSSKVDEKVSTSPYSLRPRTRSSLKITPTANSRKMAESAAVKGKTSRGKAAKVSRVPEAAPPAAASSSAACAIEDSHMDVDMISENRSEIDAGDTEHEVDRIVEEEGDGEEEEEEEEQHIEGMEEDEEDDDEENDEEDMEGRQHDLDENEEEDGHYDDDEMGDPYGDGGEEGGGSGAFSSHLRAMAGYMSGLSGKFRTLLAAIRDRKDPASQLVALQELSEVLSISNEDTLSGYFPAESFITELIYLMGGPKPSSRHSTSSTGEGSKVKAEPDEEQKREEEEMASAIAAAAGLEDYGERMLLACRCLANLIEAMPYAAHSIVSLGAVPVLNSKLMEIEFIDLAEQVLQTLEKISNEYPSAIVREDGLQAMLQFLDFFNIHIQRTAMSAAANCCRRMSVESFPKVKSILSIIKNVLSYSDQRLVESACRCVVRLVDSYRHHGEILEQVLTNEMVASINSILLPASASGSNVNSSTSTASTTTVNTVTYTDILKALGVAARVSPKTAVTLLENNVVETLYHLLTGSPAPDEDGSGGRGPAATSSTTLSQQEEDIAGAAIAIVANSGMAETVSSSTDVAVLQNLAHRPKEQVQEALSLVAELLPPLPRHGVFDSRMYTEKAYQRRKAKMAKAAKQAREAGRSSHRGVVMEKVASGDSAMDPINDDSEAITITSANLNKPTKMKTEREMAKEQAQAKRVNTLQDRQSLVKRFTQLILPTLVEVYAASVALHVRSKALFGILKIISFVEAKPLLECLDNVPLASFIAAILSSRDHPTLIQAALQVVEMLTTKLPDVYSALLRREGVMWEIEDIAAKEPTAKAVKSKASVTTDAQQGSDANTNTVTDGAASALATTTTMTSAPSLNNVTSVADLTTSDLTRLLASAGVPGGLSRLAGRIPSSSAAETVGSVHTSTTILSVSGQPMTLVEAEDSNIWRARILRDQFSPEASKASSGGAVEAGRALEEIKNLVKKLQTTARKNMEEAEIALTKTADLFAKADNPISSFELLKSGMVEGLYNFAIGDSVEVPRHLRRALMSRILNHQQQQQHHHSNHSGMVSAASAIVRRLQETLSRLETFDITTAINNPTDEARRSPTANVARQIRLKLVADDEEGDIPRNCSNLIVSIHAITSFQSLNDYLRPKIAASQAMSATGGGGGGAGAISSSAGALTSQLSGALAAFASSGGFDMYPSLRNSLTSSGNNGASSSSSTALSAALAAQKKRLTSEAKEGEEANTSVKKKYESSVKGKTSSENKSSNGESSRRRSSRLSGKSIDEAKGEKMEEKKSNPSINQNNDSMEEALARRLVEGLLQDGMEGLEDEGFTDEEDFEEDVIEDAAALEADESAADRTVNLDVAQDGTKIEAKTPEGTCIATPTNDLSKSAPTASSSTPIPNLSSSSSSSSGKGSYASALQKRPTDWHLEFQMEGVEIPLDSTIYGAIHRFEMQRQQSNASTPRYIWSNTYTVKYRKVAGPALTSKEKQTRSEQVDITRPSPQSEIDLPASIPQDAAYARILQLLRVLYDLNLEYRGNLSILGNATTSSSKGLIEATFVNNKLTAKLNRQLEEPMIVASNCLPTWSLDLPRSFPFLFPFEVRYAFLQSTSFGYHRLINKWQNQQSRNQESANSHGSNSRHDDSLSLLGRLTRQKVRISRNNILASAFKVFELYGTNSSLLEVEYFDEVGTGLGPTLEFYALVSKEFAKKGLHLWKGDDNDSNEGDYIFSPNGLFPAPCTSKMLASSKGKTILQSFNVLGQFVAKALFDSRIVDLHFSSIMMQAVIHQNVPSSMAMLKIVDPTLALSLEKLKEMNASEIDNLGLDFTLPGQTDYPLHSGGQDETVTRDNIEAYVEEVIHQTLKGGVDPLLKAFRQGFDKIFSISAMTIFTADELVMLFGNNDEDWSEATLMSSIKPDHGYNADSPTFRDIISIMSEFNSIERRDFLQWLTGSPKLPIGGFAGLHPPLTIVKRPPEANANPDKTLPSVMTCVNFCKLPPFSSKAVMRERLLLAIREGHASFHLS